MKTWMIVERLENWQVDNDGGFSTISFPDRYARRLEQFSEGDQLFTYVASRISAFSDIRRVKGRPTAPKHRANRLEQYDSIYPITLLTEPVLVLPSDKWVSFHDLVSQLSFTKDLKDWRNVVRCALRELSEEDAETIRAAMRQSARQAA